MMHHRFPLRVADKYIIDMLKAKIHGGQMDPTNPFIGIDVGITPDFTGTIRYEKGRIIEIVVDD